jgi:hypothetical protein
MGLDNEKELERLAILANEMLKITSSTDGKPLGVSVGTMIKKATKLVGETETVLAGMIPGLPELDLLGVNNEERKRAIARKFLGHEKALANYNDEQVQKILKNKDCVVELKKGGLLQDESGLLEIEALTKKIIENKKLYKKLRSIERSTYSINKK